MPLTPDTIKLLNRCTIIADVVIMVGCDAEFVDAYAHRNPNSTMVCVSQSVKGSSPYSDATWIDGDIEKGHVFDAMASALSGQLADLLVVGPEFSTLANPAKVMRRLLKRMTGDGKAAVCVSNEAYWERIMEALTGKARANGSTETPTRAFSKIAADDLFHAAGWFVQDSLPAIVDRETGLKHAQAFAKISKDLGFDPQTAAEQMIPKSWIFSLSSQEKASSIPVSAIGIGTKIDALSKIRLRQPLGVMASSGQIKPSLKIGEFGPIPEGDPGIFLTYRLHPEDKNRRDHINEKCEAGWLFVHDVDDHPAYLSGQKKNDFWSIKAAHAVTVTTPDLVEVCRQWNPNVYLVENQIFAVSDRDVLKQKSEKPALFFGALNREDDFKEQCDGMVDFLIAQKDNVACHIVHEPSLFNAMDGRGDATLHPTQTYENFIKLLSEMDIALLPLVENEFNACKSDLKLIECFAHGVVPIVSSFAAEQTSVPEKLLLVAQTPADWIRILGELLEDPKEVARRKAMGQMYVKKNRMWADKAPKVIKLYQSLIADHEKLEADRIARLSG